MFVSGNPAILSMFYLIKVSWIRGIFFSVRFILDSNLYFHWKNTQFVNIIKEKYVVKSIFKTSSTCTRGQGWTSLNKNLSWSWSFLAPIIHSELELELLGSNIFLQSWSWSFWTLKFFIELELELISSRLFFRS